MAASQSTVRRKRLGRQLQALRGDQRAEDIGAELGWSQTKVSRIERGKQNASPPDVRRLLDLYGVTGTERDGLVALAREAQQQGWWHQYSRVLPQAFGSFIDLESEAATISNFEESSVPGLLQTEEYTRAVLRSPAREPVKDDEIDRQVDTRIGRQEILRRDRPPRLYYVLDEGVIRRQVGSRDTLRGQLKRLLDAADMLTVTIQVFPYAAGGHYSPTSFVLFDFDGDPPVVYASLLGSSVYVEKPAAISAYRDAFSEERAAALSPAATIDLIAAQLKEL